MIHDQNKRQNIYIDSDTPISIIIFYIFICIHLVNKVKKTNEYEQATFAQYDLHIV